MNTIYNAILANAIEGLRKKPVFIVHLLVSTAFGTLLLWLGRLFMSNTLGHFSFNFNSDLFLVIFLTITMSILVGLIGYYVNFWHNLREHIRKEVPSMLDNALGNSYTKFIEEIMDKNFCGLIREQIKNISIGKVVAFVFSYYFAWISSLYSIDLMLYVISNHRYTLFGYMLENTYLCLIVFLIGLVLAQLIRPWVKGEEEEKHRSSREAIPSIQYLEGLFECSTSFGGLGEAWLYSRTIWGRILINFVENLLALPTPMHFGRLFIFDVFQIPYLKSTGSESEVKDLPGDIIERMLRKDPTENYCLKPFEKSCEKVPKTEILSLRRACWYKVHRRKGDKWVPIGYAMLLVIMKQSKERKFTKEHFDECMKTLKTQLRRSKQYCYDVVRELGKMYLEEKDTSIILMLGSEELLGLRLLLT